MTDIIDLTVSPRPDIIEILSEQENDPVCDTRSQENKQKKKKKKANGAIVSARSSRVHSPANLDRPPPRPRSAPALVTVDELFFFDGAPAPTVVDDSPPEPVKPDADGNGLLLPPHVTVSLEEGPIPAQEILPPKPSSDDEEYIEYLDYEDRKAPGLVRYFEAEGEEFSHAKSSIFKCKNCGAEGDHKTYECPIQICLTCGARDEHSTRSCPIGKTCYACGMKGHINKNCPNRFSTHATTSDFHGDCDRCGSPEHNANECPTLWRIYQYVKEEERILITQSREQKKGVAISEGGAGYIGKEMWCYNCANVGHLGDDCNERPHFTMEYSAFSSHNVMSGPFYDPATEYVFVRGQRRQESGVDPLQLPDDWDAGALVDVGKRGKNKDKERLEKRFREQEDEGEDWFNNIRNARKKGGRGSPPRGRKIKFGSLADGDHGPPAANGSSGLSLLARLGDAPEGRNRARTDRGRYQQRHGHPDDFVRIRGAASERGKEGHGPRYRGGYERRLW